MLNIRCQLFEEKLASDIRLTLTESVDVKEMPRLQNVKRRSLKGNNPSRVTGFRSLVKIFHQFVSVNVSLEKSENSVELFFLSLCPTVAWHSVPPALA